MSRLECPRCSYDQAGTVATWTDSCPLVTRCTECGFDIDIPQTRRDAFERLPWWVEHSRGRWKTLGASILAPVVACVPWWLYRRLRLSHPPKLSRLLLPFVTYLGGWYLALSSFASIKTLSSFPRGVVLSDVPPVLLGAFVPYTFGLGNGGMAQMMGRAAWWRASYPSMQAMVYVASVLATVAVATAAFAVLPIARRRAKLRWIHVLRGGLVLAWTAPFIAAITFPFANVPALFGGRARTIDAGLAVLAAVCIAQAALWHATARRHFRMQRPLAVALSVSTIGVLGSMVAIIVISRGL